MKTIQRRRRVVNVRRELSAFAFVRRSHLVACVSSLSGRGSGSVSISIPSLTLIESMTYLVAAHPAQ